MDAAYFVRSGPNEELRFSLRSLSNLDPAPERVWVIGDAPAWYTGPLIPGNRHTTKQRNVYDNVRIIAEHPDLPERVAVMNDDFFVIAPARVEMAYRCTLAEHIAQLKPSWWRESLTTAQTYLADQGIHEPLSYELHRPFPIVRADMARILEQASHVNPNNPPQWRTLYGNLMAAGGAQDCDGKVYGWQVKPTGSPFVSTIDRSFRSGAIGRDLRHMFPSPSPYEG